MHQTLYHALLHCYKCAVIGTDAERRSLLSVITTRRCRLADIIEPDFGLLEELLRLKVLTGRQYNKIHSEHTAAEERNDAVLDTLTSEDQCDKFLQALHRTGQQHLSLIHI